MNMLDELDFLSEDDVHSLRKFFERSHEMLLERLHMTKEEYEAFCEPYLKEASAFNDVIKEQKGKKPLLEKNILEHAVREEKSRGGECIHRGFYCPSLIQDIVIGNCKRGSLCKATNPKAIYTHYFDSDNKHIATRKQDDGMVSTEYIVYRGNKSLGLTFDGGDRLEAVAECEYDEKGRIRKYVFALCVCDAVTEVYKELYAYSEKNIIVEISELNGCIAPVQLSLNKYNFQIESGLLKNYTIEVFDNEDLSDQPLNTRMFAVKVKRKVSAKENL